GHEIGPRRVKLVSTERKETLSLPGGSDLRVINKLRDCILLGNSCQEFQHCRPFSQCAVFVSELKRRFRVGSGNRCKFCHIRYRYSSAASCSSILLWAA